MLSITCIDVWLSTSMQGSKLNFPENHLLGTYNCKMVAIKQIFKKNSQIEGYFMILHYMRYLGRQMTHLPHFHLPTWYVHSLADEKIVVMIRKVRMKKLWFQEAEMITRKFLRPSKKSFLIWFWSIAQLRNIMFEVSWNSGIKAFDIRNNIFNHLIIKIFMFSLLGKCK